MGEFSRHPFVYSVFFPENHSHYFPLFPLIEYGVLCCDHVHIGRTSKTIPLLLSACDIQLQISSVLYLATDLQLGKKVLMVNEQSTCENTFII